MEEVWEAAVAVFGLAQEACLEEEGKEGGFPEDFSSDEVHRVPLFSASLENCCENNGAPLAFPNQMYSIGYCIRRRLDERTRAYQIYWFVPPT